MIAGGDKTVTCRDFDGNFHEVPVGDLRWRPSAYGIVIQGKTVLLLKQNNGYDLPGGGVDLGETLEEGVIREVKEESGLTVENPRLIDVKTSFFMFSHAQGDTVESIGVYYACDYVSGEINNDGFDEYEKEYAEGCEWFPIAGLDNITVAASVDWRPYVTELVR